MRVSKGDFDAALAKLLKAKPLPLAEIPMRDGSKRKKPKPAKATR